MNKIYLIILVGLLIVGAVLFINQNKPLPKQEISVSAPEVNTSSSPVQEFVMTAKNWSFDPGTITVKQGERVRFKIKSVDVEHGFALPDFGIDKKLEPGKEVVVEFVADKKGEFSFYCSVFCGQGHREMTGKLVVL